MLFVGERRAFTRGANRNKSVAAFAHMPLDKFFQRIQIQFAVRERRNQCG